jgi:predicted transcriptional regulator with HTH domain
MDGTMIRSIKRSALRVKVLRALRNRYPDSMYLYEIAQHCLSDSCNVRGALTGFGIRYAPDLSLVNIGLVVVTHKGAYSYYSLNPDRMKDVQDILNLVNAKSVTEVFE